MNSQVEVKVAGKVLFDSAVVHVGKNDEVSIHIEELVFKFKFITDERDNSSGYTGSVIDGEFIMKLRNFNSAVGEGVLKPVEIGNYNGKKLYISFFVNTYRNRERKFEYNLFLGEGHE